MGIGELHSRNIMHRDLKLENILIQTNGYVKIINFAKAKLLRDDNELASTLVGTPEYRAPEMLNTPSMVLIQPDQPVIPRKPWYDMGVDWWAVGVMAYEMVYGATPFFD